MEDQEIRQRLAGIVERRHSQLPLVMTQLARLDDVENALNSVSASASELPPEWSGDPIVRDALDRLRDVETTQALAQARALLRSVEGRFARESINVGVGGRARVGKSLMLQSISGLTDEQVPTGEGTNVTAIRSRIFHAAEQRAYVSFHTRATFLDEVVRPYFDDLGISPTPTSFEAFSSMAHQPSPSVPSTLEGRFEEAKRKRLSEEIVAKWKRLIEIGHALPQLRLDGGEARFDDLSNLRKFVAYPTTADKDREDAGGQPAPRNYLGVRDCRIESPFPVTELDRLALVDLPGLGESASGIDERIVAGLRTEVDVVLMVFRSVPGLSSIDTIDRAALDLITRAQGEISDSRDFACIVINSGPGEESARAELKSELQREINNKKEDSRYFVRIANARDPQSMHLDALLPVLNRLAKRLPDMDQEVLQGAVAAMDSPLRSIRSAATSLQEAIQATMTQSGQPREKLDKLAPELRKDVQQSLAVLKPYRLGDEYLTTYLEEIETIHAAVRDWLSDGLGRFDDRADWIDFANRQWGVDRSHGPFANSELHRLRVEVTSRYAQLDSFLNGIVEDFYGLVCGALSGEGHGSVNYSEANRQYLLGDSAKPSEQLGQFARRLRHCGSGVPTLVSAVERLENIHFDFRMQSYPLLHDLNLDMRPVDGAAPDEVFPPPFGEKSTAYMYEWFAEQFIEFSFRAKRELRQDAQRQFRVLSGAAVVFEDEMIRSGASVAEFRNLAEGYCNELWPGEFDGINNASARAGRLSKAVLVLSEAIDSALEVAK